MTGDQSDMVGRLRLTLPTRWFAEAAPVLDSVLAGLAAGWAALYNLLLAARTQSRIGTATDTFLDMAAQDFFGGRFWRRSGEADAAFRARLLWAMKRDLVTRGALVAVAQQAGYSLDVFEPMQPSDTGAYNVGTKLAWNVSGGYGSLQMPFECLATAQSTGAGDYSSELWAGLALAKPSGGVVWLRVQQ